MNSGTSRLSKPGWCNYQAAEAHGIDYREVKLLAGAAQGMQNVEIGAELDVAEDTIKSAFTKLFRKLKVHDRAAAVAIAYDIGIFRPLHERIERAERMRRWQTAS